MEIRWIWVAVVATLFALATPFAYADDGNGDDDNGAAVAPLTLESLLAQEIGQGSEISESTVTGTCNPTGMSEFEFEITGLATGPYPGTFIETGTIVLNAFGDPMNPVLAAESFESTFTINSPAGTVEGSKSLVGFEATSQGLCGTAAFPTGGADALRFTGTVSYTAEITTSTMETGMDSGESFVNLGDSQRRNDPLTPNGFSFSETFASDTPPGGGDDDDDQGDDDDDQGEDDDD